MSPGIRADPCETERVHRDGRMKNDANVIVTGLMGSGKSTVGALLAAKLDRPFVDMDVALEERHGPIRAVFDQPDGDKRFQKLEQDLATELSAERGLVIATGGRTMTDALSAERLASTGVVFCLNSSDTELVERLSKPGSTTYRPRFLAATNREALMADLRAASADAFSRYEQVDTGGLSAASVADLLAERCTH